jgi:CDP-diglyceride synthetase
VSQESQPIVGVADAPTDDHRSSRSIARALKSAAVASPLLVVCAVLEGDPWAFVPTMLGLLIVAALHYSPAQVRSAARRATAVIGAFVVWMALILAGTRIFPGADRHHSGPERGLVFVVAAILLVACYMVIGRLAGGNRTASTESKDT